MKQFRTILIAILAAVAARADYIDLTFQSQDASALYFPSFDSTLGELNSVSVRASALLTKTISFGPSSTSSNQVGVMANMYLYGTAPGSRPAIGSTAVDMASGSAPTTLELSGTSQINREWSSNLGAFSGPDPWRLHLGPVIFYHMFDKPAGVELTGGSFTMTDLSGYTTYGFTPVDPVVTHTPEPGFYALVGLGLAGMVVVRRSINVRRTSFSRTRRR